MHSRRAALKGALLGFGVAAVASPALANGPARVVSSGGVGPSSPLSLFSNLPALDSARVVHVGEPIAGGVPMLVEGRNGLFQVDACRASDTGHRGIARSKSLDLFVHNGGRGDIATDTEHILATRALAAELTRREEQGAEVPELLTWKERQSLIRSDRYTVDVLTPYLADRRQ